MFFINEIIRMNYNIYFWSRAAPQSLLIWEDVSMVEHKAIMMQKSYGGDVWCRNGSGSAVTRPKLHHSRGCSHYILQGTIHHRSVITYCRVHHQVAIILIVSVTFIPSQHSDTYGKEALKNLCIFQKTFLYICDMISLRFSQRSIKLYFPYFRDSLTIIIGGFSFG